MNRIGIFAKTFPGQTASSVLTAARDAGYGCVQFNLSCCGLPSMPDSLPAELVADIAAASANTGVTIAALSGTYNMIHPDPMVRAQGLARLRVLLSHARAMGTSLVTLCTGTRDPDDQWRAHPENEAPEAWADLLVEMEQAAAMAEELGVDLGIEPEPANVVGSAARAARLLREIPSPRLRIILDPANLAAGTNADQDRIFESAADFLHERIALAHAKDRDAAGEVVPPGQGIIDFPRFFAHLTRVGFRGPVITHGIAPEDAPQVARFVAQTLGS
ncbi:MAG TPA: sugar phosphate isomerase/epimerase [Acidisoma sp.]|jgi:sugar phosphate isomerase/epimerase|uniref:sugar phosphate isomerase/epimerase family protein n=1 Tax=Acidisoma sp. TaxID=1872115 RepID=UPI002BFD9131|nr:sugar phosphate isomerase/epimerase [Acidisoma sp.]HTI03302.1 sugar phosphate isomerase/epimerase [Acidisoma sp.]